MSREGKSEVLGGMNAEWVNQNIVGVGWENNFVIIRN